MVEEQTGEYYPENHINYLEIVQLVTSLHRKLELQWIVIPKKRFLYSGIIYFHFFFFMEISRRTIEGKIISTEKDIYSRQV